MESWNIHEGAISNAEIQGSRVAQLVTDHVRGPLAEVDVTDRTPVSGQVYPQQPGTVSVEFHVSCVELYGDYMQIVIFK